MLEFAGRFNKPELILKEFNYYHPYMWERKLTKEVVDKLNSINRLVGLDVYFSDGTNKQEAVFKTVSVLDEDNKVINEVKIDDNYDGN